MKTDGLGSEITGGDKECSSGPSQVAQACANNKVFGRLSQTRMEIGMSYMNQRDLRSNAHLGTRVIASIVAKRKAVRPPEDPRLTAVPQLTFRTAAQHQEVYTVQYNELLH